MQRDDIAALLRALKQVYKKANLRYADVARALGASEVTIKRYMSAKGLTLAILQRLCAIGETSLIELAKLADHETPELLEKLDGEQVAGLMEDPMLGLTCLLLSRGWSAEQIARDFDIDDIKVTRLLTRLDRLAIIALYPGNRVRLLRALRYPHVPGSASFAAITQRTKEVLSTLDLSDAELTYSHGICRLSEESRANIARQFENLRNEVYRLQDHDLALPPDQARWCMLFSTLMPVNVEQVIYPSTT